MDISRDSWLAMGMMSVVDASRLRDRWLALGLTTLLGGCSVQGVPTQPSGRVHVTVEVRVRVADTPIVGARAYWKSDGSAFGGRCVTNPQGECILEVVAARQVEIRVEAPGYVGFSASAIPGDGERWSFWLEREDR